MCDVGTLEAVLHRGPRGIGRGHCAPPSSRPSSSAFFFPDDDRDNPAQQDQPDAEFNHPQAPTECLHPPNSLTVSERHRVPVSYVVDQVDARPLSGGRAGGERGNPNADPKTEGAG
jgi:hypothetical protein